MGWFLVESVCPPQFANSLGQVDRCSLSVTSWRLRTVLPTQPTSQAKLASVGYTSVTPRRRTIDSQMRRDSDPIR